MANILTLDIECQSYNKGNPFDTRNYPICFAYKFKDQPANVIWNDHVYDLFAAEIQRVVEQANYIIGFNLKFDLHWLRWCGVTIPESVHLLDGQVAEFLISNQTHAYPSLDDCALKYLNEQKIDEVKLNYWDQDKLSSEVPQEVMTKYALRDVELTEAVLGAQIPILRSEGKLKLFQLQMEDLKVLQEMEWNGLKFNEEEAKRLSSLAKTELANIDNELFGNHPYRSFINPNSGDHLSVFLYGGSIIHEERVPNGVFKTGAKTGLPRYKIVKYELKFKRQFEPIEGSELKKEGYYSTDEKVLRKLRGNKRLIELILKRSELEKLCGTYYDGLIKIREKMNWEENTLHGQLNMVVARTGRLSASEPNQQNMAKDIKDLFYSRY